MVNNKVKAMIYMNNTGNEALDGKAMSILEKYCEKKGYEIAVGFGEDTDREGISEPVKFMMVGLAVEKQVDVIVTMFSEMISDNYDGTVEILSKLLGYNVMFETVQDDLNDYYDEAFEQEADMCDGDCDNCGIANDESVIEELNRAFYE